jgi:hypothetical protein
MSTSRQAQKACLSSQGTAARRAGTATAENSQPICLGSVGRRPIAIPDPDLLNFIPFLSAVAHCRVTLGSENSPVLIYSRQRRLAALARDRLPFTSSACPSRAFHKPLPVTCDLRVCIRPSSIILATGSRGGCCASDAVWPYVCSRWCRSPPSAAPALAIPSVTPLIWLLLPRMLSK